MEIKLKTDNFKLRITEADASSATSVLAEIGVLLAGGTNKQADLPQTSVTRPASVVKPALAAKPKTAAEPVEIAKPKAVAKPIEAVKPKAVDVDTLKKLQEKMNNGYSSVSEEVPVKSLEKTHVENVEEKVEVTQVAPANVEASVRNAEPSVTEEYDYDLLNFEEGNVSFKGDVIYKIFRNRDGDCKAKFRCKYSCKCGYEAYNWVDSEAVNNNETIKCHNCLERMFIENNTSKYDIAVRDVDGVILMVPEVDDQGVHFFATNN